MARERLLVAGGGRATLLLTLLVVGATCARAAAAQELSPALSRLIPTAADRLRSADVRERIGVLEELVPVQRDYHLVGLKLRYELPASDYAAVVRSVLAADLTAVDEGRAGETWTRITLLVRTFSLREFGRAIAGYLPKLQRSLQFQLLDTLKTLNAVEAVPDIVPLLRVPDEAVRGAALDALVHLRSREAVPVLVALLEDKDAYKRHYVLDGLVKLNAREAAPAIAKALTSGDEGTRVSALRALVKLEARDYAPQFWQFTSGYPSHTEAYAIAALIRFSQARAVPLAVKRATEADLTRRLEMLNHLVELGAAGVAPAFVGLLESRDVLGGNPNDLGTNGYIRRDIIDTLGRLRARVSIPVLRAYARGDGRDHYLQEQAVVTLGELGVREAVDDLLPRLDVRPPGGAYAAAEAAVALARIGERRTWARLIDLAADPACPYRAEIILELNRHLDPELWERVNARRVRGRYILNVKETVEAFSRDGGVPIVLHFRPGVDTSPRAPLGKDVYPWANTHVGESSLLDGLRKVILGISDERTPRTHTFVFDDKQVHVMSVERAVEWWRGRLAGAQAKPVR